MSPADAPLGDGAPFQELAQAKLVRVLGPAQAAQVYAETLAAAGLTAIASADDLYRFATHLSKRGGFAAAVGGLLSVAAVLRGAAGDGRDGPARSS